MVTQFVPAPIAWDAILKYETHTAAYEVVGWLCDGKTTITVVSVANGMKSLNELFTETQATAYELVRV